MIYPAEGRAISGTVTVNGLMTADFSMEAGGKPGTAVILPFEPETVTSLKLAFSEQAAIGEVMLIGPAP